MSTSKKYFYLKLKDSYFDQDNIKIMEAQENGYIYSLIVLKLYLKSIKHDGKLMMTDSIPYDPDNIDILAKVLNHDIAHVKEAIRLGVELELITILNTKEIWMTDIQNFIGESSTEADRIRKYRKKLKGVQMYDKSTPELEIELKKELKLKKDNKSKKHKYGEYKHVLLTDEEYEKLKDKVDNREEWIKKLDEGIELKGYKYKNHYLAILKWYKSEKEKIEKKYEIVTEFEEVAF